MLGLIIATVTAIMVLLGYSATWFAGTDFFFSLLPFAFSVLGLLITAALLLLGWWKFRTGLQGRLPLLAPILSMGLVIVIIWMTSQNMFSQPFGQFRKLVGGSQETLRNTLAHQVYATYRRTNLTQLRILLKRAGNYSASIQEAANLFDIDPALLHGIAAAESSFLPRDSHDGGQGLFQITRAPKAAMVEASRYLSENRPDLLNARHNAFVAAATLQYYLTEMNNDLFLGLLAYNIGPANGGLRFIMQQYGAKDFVSIQPYLQQLPREYPIRVLSYALAFRIWQKEGNIQAYEKGNNALHIQNIGIPELSGGKLDIDWSKIFNLK